MTSDNRPNEARDKTKFQHEKSAQSGRDASSRSANSSERSDLSSRSHPGHAREHSRHSASSHESHAHKHETGESKHAERSPAQAQRLDSTADAARAISRHSTRERTNGSSAQSRDRSPEKQAGPGLRDTHNRSERSDLRRSKSTETPADRGKQDRDRQPPAQQDKRDAEKYRAKNAEREPNKSNGQEKEEGKGREEEKTGWQSQLAHAVETTAKTLEAVTSEKLFDGKAVTAVEGVAGAASRAIGKGAEALAGHAPDGAARAIFEAADKAQNALGKIDGEAIARFEKSDGFKAFGAGAAGFAAFTEAQERGVSKAASDLDALAAGAINTVEELGSPVDAAINVAQAGINAVSKEAGQYTGPIADATPSRMATELAVGTIDAVTAMASGDSDRLIQQADNNLQGKYGEPIRGYAIAADALGATITGDSKALNDLSDAAAGGKLGVPAKLGDEIGDWVGKHVPLPQSLIRTLGL
jgi:hypothetical protein